LGAVKKSGPEGDNVGLKGRKLGNGTPIREERSGRFTHLYLAKTKGRSEEDITKEAQDLDVTGLIEKAKE